MSTQVVSQSKATVADLYQVKGKAELIHGKVVQFMPTGGIPNIAAGNIVFSLKQYERTHGGGHVLTDNAAFLVDLPNRESFSPDVAWWPGQATMKFFDGAPALAVEVRSEGDYGKAAEAAIAEKRREYFSAGTLVVWDVDLLSDDVVRVYRADAPDQPVIYRRGEIAEAEPAVPGWRFPVDELFQ